MIDFEQVWLPQIVAYARLIETGRMEAQWLGQSGMTTSVTDPDELHEQIFDDLDAIAVWSDVRQNGYLPASAVSAIDRFLAALSDIEGNQAKIVVNSTAWAEGKEAARALLTNVH